MNVLRLLLGARSLSINRAAIAAANTSPELGRILAAKGRETTRPLVERYLNAQHDAARLNVPDVGEAFEVLMGLLVRDLQIRTLLGVAQPLRGRALERRAEAAVEAFLRLYG